MKNTERFYKTVSNFQRKRAEINAAFDDTMKRHAQLEGSPLYREIVDKAMNERDNALLTLRTETWAEVQAIVSDMRATAASRPLVAPSVEQLSILQALQMRSKLNTDELKRAEHSLAGCPIALAVLDDLAEKHGIIRATVRPELSSADVAKYIDALQNSAQKLLAGNNARLDRERADMVELLSEYGGFGYRLSENSLGGQNAEVNREKVAEFAGAVDGGENA